MLHRNPFTRAQALAVRRDVFVNKYLLHSDIVAHVGVSAALLGLLGRPIHETYFVCVFTRVCRHALALEGTKNIVGAVVLVEIFLLSAD